MPYRAPFILGHASPVVMRVGPAITRFAVAIQLAKHLGATAATTTGTSDQ